MRSWKVDDRASMLEEVKTRAAVRSAAVMAVMVLIIMMMSAVIVSAASDQGEVKIVDPVGQPDNYSAVLYDNTNGLPTAEANAITQTSEGFIWIGSYGGLIRYDGKTFERMDSTKGVASVVSLFVDSSDRLWIGTNDSGLALMENGEFRMWGADDGLNSPYVCTIAEDSSGTIYVGTTEGVNIVSPDDFSLKSIDDPKVEGAYIESIKLGSDGLLYCLTYEDDCFTLRDGKLIDFYGHDDRGFSGITSIMPDSDNPGKVYMATADGGFYYGDLKDRKKMKKMNSSPLLDVMEIQKFGDQIWICYRNGIGVFKDGKFHYMSDLPMNNSVNHVMTDYEGNLWFTSARMGVMKVVTNQFSDIFVRYGIEQNVVNTTCLSDDDLFIGTDTGLIVVGKKGVKETVPLKSAETASGKDLQSSDLLKLLEGVRIRSIMRDSKGRLWISTWRTDGLMRYDKGKLTAFTSADGLLSDQVRMIAEAEDGSIMAVCAGGLSVIKGDRVVKNYAEADGITNTATLTAAIAPNGDVLVGSDGGGIYIIGKDGTVKNVSTHDGLSSGIVMRIKHDIKKDLFWLITSNSISYMTEDYKVTTVEKFPYSNNLDLYENSKGDMWVLSSNGIYVLPSDELVANKEIKPVHYSLANGLPCITTSNSYSELTENGDLYLSGTTGVAKVNIESSLEDINNIKQAVPFIDADGVRYYPDKSGAYRIPSSVQKLIVHGFVYNYSLTDPQVSYRLNGFDHEEVTVNRSDLGPVSYTNLPGGTYDFQLELKDALGRGSNTMAVTIVKEKAFYEQPWFYLLMLALAALLIAILVQLYINRRMRAMEAKHREEAERERIERELQMASRIQSGILPHEFPPFPDRKEFDIFASMEPAKEIGGDFYDYFFVDDDHLCVVMADVSGKGVPAALFMMVSKAILQSVGGMCSSASDTLNKANALICSNNQEKMFVTVWIGILEISTGKLTAANAGHEYPAIKQTGEKFELLKDKHGFVVGGMKGIKYKEYEVQMEPGSKIFLYTDGVPEAKDAEDNMFGTDRMVDALNKDPDGSPEQILKNVRTAVDEFVKDAEQFDDLTMLCLDYHPDKH